MKKGVVYTPAHWADWAVVTCKIADKWINGATVLDPGCGAGALCLAIFREAKSSGFTPSADDLARIVAIDRDSEAVETFQATLMAEFGYALPPTSFREQDYLLNSPEITADIVFSNPPWVSFNDLELDDKELYKPVFRSSGLTPDPRNLLLGGARVDISALFVAISLNRDLAENGEGFFFLPQSLFRSEGAHRAFRRPKFPGGRVFSLTHIWNMSGAARFPGAGTAWCFARYQAETPQIWPVSWSEPDGSGNWLARIASPADPEGGPLIPHSAGTALPASPEIPVPAGSLPRQGVNSGGASDVFILEELGERKDGSVEVISRGGRRGRLPAGLIHPLMSSGCFTTGAQSTGPEPDRWVFLPYSSDGKVMPVEEILRYPDALEWLEIHRQKLQSRKGSLLARYSSRGIWWALLGVASYAFSPIKLGWEAYGRRSFNPRIFLSREGAVWQGNQALHAYIPFPDLSSAESALERLKSPGVETYLRDLGGGGTKSWAQPGRIRRLLRIETSESDQ